MTYTTNTIRQIADHFRQITMLSDAREALKQKAKSEAVAIGLASLRDIGLDSEQMDSAAYVLELLADNITSIVIS